MTLQHKVPINKRRATTRNRHYNNIKTPWRAFAIMQLLFHSSVWAQVSQAPSAVITPATLEPSPLPTFESTPTTTMEPTAEPTAADTTTTTVSPSPSPSASTTASPTSTVASSTSVPTSQPSSIQTSQPSSTPTSSPTVAATTTSPTTSPSASPSLTTLLPTTTPTFLPTITESSLAPTAQLTLSPSITTTSWPSSAPSITALSSEQPTSTIVTTEPTGSPTTTTTTTTSPTMIPSTIPPSTAIPSSTGGTAIPVNGTVGVNLLYVSGTMNDNTLEIFRFISQAFLSNALSMLEQPVSSVEVIRVYNQQVSTPTDVDASGSAGLQQLTVQLDATGDFRPRQGFATASEDLDYSRLLRNVFTVQSPAFISLLQQSGNDYFSTVISVNSVVIQDETNNIENNGENSSSSNSGLSTGVIIAIVLGSVVVCCLFAVGYRYARTTSRPRNYFKSTGPNNNTSLAVNTSMGSSSNAAAASRNRKLDSSFWTPLKKSKQPQRRQAPPSSARSSNLSYVEDGQSSPKSQVSSYSYRQRTKSSGDSSWNDGSYLANSSKGGGDLTYAYSLDDGIQDAATYDPGSISSGTTMLGTTIAGGSLSAPSFQDEHDIPPGKAQRDVYAPPGRLGIVVDTTLDGPQVMSLKDDSPLVGVIRVDDLIVAIDDVDTRNMTANSIGQLMANSISRRRKLTLWSDVE